MVQIYRRGLTAAQKTELWDRWQRGESLKAIGRTFGKQSSSIYCLVPPHGGIRPAVRQRSRLALTRLEREQISRGMGLVCTPRSRKTIICSPAVTRIQTFDLPGYR
jgi:IS30 family transposase